MFNTHIYIVQPTFNASDNSNQVVLHLTMDDP